MYCPIGDNLNPLETIVNVKHVWIDSPINVLNPKMRPWESSDIFSAILNAHIVMENAYKIP